MFINCTRDNQFVHLCQMINLIMPPFTSFQNVKIFKCKTSVDVKFKMGTNELNISNRIEDMLLNPFPNKP